MAELIYCAIDEGFYSGEGREKKRKHDRRSKITLLTSAAVTCATVACAAAP